MSEAIQHLNAIKVAPKFAFDYETTNAYPYDEDFEIVTIAFGLKQSAFVLHESLWKNSPSNWEIIRKEVSNLLVNPNIKKIIQNSKFEDLASRYVLKIKWIENMECTMLASHTIDERQGGNSLDFQNLVRFGIPPYSQNVAAMLKAKEGSRVNRIREIPVDQLVEYTGLDVITTYNNWELIDSTLFQSYSKARENYEMLRKGHWTYGNIQQRGITLSESECNHIDSILEQKANEILQTIYAMPEFKAFNEYMRTKSTKKTKDKKTAMSKLEDKINASRRSSVAQPNTRIDGGGISQSLRDRIAQLKRTVTFQ
jgi:DNA polymerase I-like protein with 3'-5' exonuclease and polymerase domains